MYNFISRVRFSEVGADEKMTLEALLDYFQDCSTFHSEDIGVGINYLKEVGMVWVLSSWQIVIYRYPKLCENITVGTFPYDFKGAIGYRNFFMKDESGNMLAVANSVWTLLDVEKMFPVKPTALMIEKYLIEEKMDMEYAPRKIVMAEKGVEQEYIIVKKHQIDTNHHVNNGQYVRMAMGFLPEKYQIHQMRAEYRKSAMLNDIIVPTVRMVRSSETTGICQIALQTEDKTANYCVVEFS